MPHAGKSAVPTVVDQLGVSATHIKGPQLACLELLYSRLGFSFPSASSGRSPASWEEGNPTKISNDS